VKRTSLPSSQSISSDTRLATDMAATRRGCVQPTMPYVVYPSSCMYCVSCGEKKDGDLAQGSGKCSDEGQWVHGNAA